MKRALLLATVLSAAIFAVAQPQDPEGPTTLEESECTVCHRIGGQGSGPSLTRLFKLQLAENTTLAPGEAFPFQINFVNTWVSQLFDIEALIDISEAPTFGFTARPAPLRDQFHNGEFPDRTTNPTGPERTYGWNFTAPGGGTEFRLRVEPATTSGDDAPDLELRIWTPAQDREEDPPLVIDDGGAGESEVYVMKRQPLDPVPGGQWHVEVAQGAWTTSPFDTSRLSSQDFRISWDLWFNVTETDPLRFLETNLVLEPIDEDEGPFVAPMVWQVSMHEPLVRKETILVRGEATAYYKHATQSGGVDEWRVFVEKSFDLRPPPPPEPDEEPGETPIVIEEEEEPELEPITDERTSIGMDQWGEMVGYWTAFLIALTTVSGGAFGGWTAKVQDWISRGRRRRIAFHSVTGYGLLLGAIAHLVLFVIEDLYVWTVGWLLGGIAVLGILALAVTGLYQQKLIRSIGFEAWRWTHFILTIVTVLATALHIALDGIHFVEFQEAVGWEDPLKGVLDDIGTTAPDVPAGNTTLDPTA